MSKRNPIIAPWPVGARGGLIDEKHRQAMGEAVFLFMWCLLRQTEQKDGWGIVLYGKPITYEFIHDETGFPIRTLERWMRLLADTKYLRIERRQRGLVIWIAKAKKWWGNTTKTASGKTVKDTSKSQLARLCDPPRTADQEPPRTADHHTKSGGSQPIQVSENQQLKAPPNSKSVELLNSTEIRHDAGASGVPSFADLIRNTQLPGKRPLSNAELDARRRAMADQADKVLRMYPGTRRAG